MFVYMSIFSYIYILISLGENLVSQSLLILSRFTSIFKNNVCV